MKNVFFKTERKNGNIILTIFGFKLQFKNLFINPISDCCCISNLHKLLENNVQFPNPIGIVISPLASIGKNCTIYQNVTIGQKGLKAPEIGDNVIIGANSCVLGGIKVGDNVTIYPGSVVIKDVQANAKVMGNPGKIIEEDK